MTWSRVSSAGVALAPRLSPAVDSLGFLQVVLEVLRVRSSDGLLRGKCSSFSFVSVLCQTTKYFLIAGRSETEYIIYL